MNNKRLCKSNRNTPVITQTKLKSVSDRGDVSRSFSGDKNDDYFQLRMNRTWKDNVKMISEMNNVSFSQFIRQSVDKNIQSLSR
jgi:hypothetical protein